MRDMLRECPLLKCAGVNSTETERAALEWDWPPLLDGAVPFEEALRNVVRDATK